VKNVGTCEECGREVYINSFGFCKRCNKDLTNKDLEEKEE
jgi:ribosomal protein S14